MYESATGRRRVHIVRRCEGEIISSRGIEDDFIHEDDLELRMEMIYESGIDGGPEEGSIMKHSTYKRLDKTRISLNECQAKASTSGPGTCLLWTNCVPWGHMSMQVCLSYTLGTRDPPSIELTNPLRSDKIVQCALSNTTHCSRPRACRTTRGSSL